MEGNLEKCLAEFGPTLIKLSRCFVIPHITDEDIAQELRLHLFLQFEKRKKPIKSFNDWAFICCRKKIIDIYRKETRKRRWPGNPDFSLDVLMDNGFDTDGKNSVFISRE